MNDETKEPMQFTLALIKSRAIEQGHADNIRHEMGKLYNCRVIAEVYGETCKAAFERLYEEHQGRAYYDGLIESVTSPASAQVFVLYGPDVIKKWRNKVGATNPSNAFEGTIRHRYGLNMPHNAAHGSDSVESAIREIAIFFPYLDLSGMEIASITQEAGIAA